MVTDTSRSLPFSSARVGVPLAFAFVALFAACDDFDPPSLVADLRVLAVRAEPPEVAPGASVALDALVVDPLDRPQRFAWYACLLPELTNSGFGGDAETQSSGGNGTPLSDDPYGGSCWRRVEAAIPNAVALGTEATATFVVPADLFATDEALATAYGLPAGVVVPAPVKALLLDVAGLNYTIELVVEVDGEDGLVRRIETQKRVNVSLGGSADNPINTNPRAPLVHVSDQATPTVPPTGPVAAVAGCIGSGATQFASRGVYDLFPIDVPTPGVAYPVLLASRTAYSVETVEETLFYSFFATRAKLETPVLKAVGDAHEVWRIGSGAGPVDLWIVVRDGRGGIAWCHEQVVVGP